MALTEPLLRALIVDDEEPGRVNLRCLLAAHPGWLLAGECANAAQARAVLAATPVDVVFLDIRMPHESGLELARSIGQQDAPPLVIFVTAYDTHATDAFDVHALDYLLKPVRRERLAKALERAAHMLALRQRGPYAEAMRAWMQAQAQPGYLQHLTVRSVGSIERVALDDVFWIGAANNYVELHMAKRTVLHRATLSQLEANLDPQRFLRVHRRAIVRADQIGTLSVVGDGSYLLRLRCGAEVGVSESHVQAVRDRCV